MIPSSSLRHRLRRLRIRRLFETSVANERWVRIGLAASGCLGKNAGKDADATLATSSILGRIPLYPPPCFAKSGEVIWIDGVSGGCVFKSVQGVENKAFAGGRIRFDFRCGFALFLRPPFDQR